MGKPLVSKEYLLEKHPGKGGWTYARIPEIQPDKKSPFGWVKVEGNIDGVAFKGYRLQPMGKGKLFFPVKAAIRKRIGKDAGDFVKIVLYKDDTPLEVPVILVACLRDEPGAYEKFLRRSEGEQKAFIDWIYAAKKDETRVKRIAITINKIMSNQKINHNEHRQNRAI